MNYPADAGSVAVQVRPAYRWISRTAAVTVAGLAGIAGALSYSHMRQLAQDHGPWNPAYPARQLGSPARPAPEVNPSRTPQASR